MSDDRLLLDVEELQVSFAGALEPVVKGISFRLQRGECLAIVGESGSGKSVTSRTLVGLTGANAQISAKRLAFAGEDLQRFGPKDWRRTRGARIGLVMQDALGSLDPLRRVGQEVAEALELHTDLTRAEREEKVLELLKSVGMPEPELRAQQYPFQLSGGLRQRALIASAIACDPDLIIADEPTTALDATVQAQVIELLQSLQSPSRGMLVISHDMGVVSQLATHVAVMQFGQIVEYGRVEEVLYSPQHPYTQALLKAAAAVHIRRDPSLKADLRDQHAEAATVLEGRLLSKSFKGPDGQWRTVVKPTSLRLRQGETLGIVGESGSGKTTLTRLLLALEKPDAGKVLWRGQDWAGLSAAEQRQERRRVQVIFQDPLGSFDPRYTVARVLDEALKVAGVSASKTRHTRAKELLQLVRLDSALLSRRPLELSGGQRQRVAIARALAANPQVLVCDEPVSALDVSVQAQILELLSELKQRLGLACLFISHDLGVVQQISDRVMVMKDGEVIESGVANEVFSRPQHPYTRQLVGAIGHLYIHPEKGVRVEALAC